MRTLSAARSVLVSLPMMITMASASIAHAQAPATTQPVYVNPAGTVRMGDLVEVAVDDLVGANVSTAFLLRVDPAGRVGLPLIKPVVLKDLTTDVAAVRIAKAYADAKLIQDAFVSVAIRELGTHPSIQLGPIASGDVVRVSIADLETSGAMASLDVTVTSEGTVALPHLDAVKLAGLSEIEAASAIARAYAAAQLIEAAQVTALRIADPKKSPAPTTRPAATKPTMPLQVGDVVEIGIDDLMAVGQTSTYATRVDAEGRVFTPLLGRLAVAGKSGDEAAQLISMAYGKANIVPRARVSIAVRNGLTDQPRAFVVGDTVEIQLLSLHRSGDKIYGQLAADGTVHLPMIGPLKLMGLTEELATQALADQIKRAALEENPIFSLVRTTVP